MISTIKRANIERSEWPGQKSLEDAGYVNLYLGSGRFGGCFDAYGLMNRPYANWIFEKLQKGRYSGNWESARIANTVFMHADHWSRGNYGLDYHLPVLRLAWSSEVGEVTGSYRQLLDIYDGLLTTGMAFPQGTVALAAAFNPRSRDVFVLRVEFTRPTQAPPLSISLLPQTEVAVQYENFFAGSCAREEYCPEENTWSARLRVGTSDTALRAKLLVLEGSAAMEPTHEGFKMNLSGNAGRFLLLLGVAGYARKAQMETAILEAAASPDYFAECADAWHKRWGCSWVSVPDGSIQNLWSRSLYYLLCSYSPDPDCVAPPCGWTGNGWNYHFIQDFSYILPALLRLGHTDIAKAKVEFYHGRLEEGRKLAKKLYDAEGVFWAWEFPVGPGFDLYQNGAPNPYQFELHNGGYPARMAYETAMHLNDPKWTREIALPIITESARFYASVMTREADSTWGIHITPAMGQDEVGGFNARNYLCCLFSAKYCLKTAVKLSEALGLSGGEIDNWKKILGDGLAFTRVYDASAGIYRVSELAMGGKGGEFWQKHPVQLNPLFCLPFCETDEPLDRAYRKRHDLCYGMKEGFVPGWTLGAFWVAASHMQDGDAMLSAMEQSLAYRYTDKDMLQFYESSGYVWMQYYTTTHGLYLQAVNDALASDYWGNIQIGSALPSAWERASFHHLHTMDGESGTREISRIVDGGRDDSNQ